jgi:hypothetical protein
VGRLEDRRLHAILSPSSQPTWEGNGNGTWGAHDWNPAPSLDVGVEQYIYTWTFLNPAPSDMNFASRWDATVQVLPQPGTVEQIGDPVEVKASASVSGSSGSSDVYAVQTFDASASLGDQVMFSENHTGHFAPFHSSGTATLDLRIGDSFSISYLMQGDAQVAPELIGSPRGWIGWTIDGYLHGNLSYSVSVVPLTSRIAVTSLGRSPDGGVDFGYSITGADLPRATTAALYWAPAPTFDSSRDTLIPGSLVNTQTAVGSYGPIHVAPAQLGTPPRGTK